MLLFCFIKFHFKLLHRCHGKKLPPVLPVCSSLFESWRCGEGWKATGKQLAQSKPISRRVKHDKTCTSGNEPTNNHLKLYALNCSICCDVCRKWCCWPLPHLCPLGALKHRPALPGSAPRDTVRNTVRNTGGFGALACRRSWGASRCFKVCCQSLVSTLAPIHFKQHVSPGQFCHHCNMGWRFEVASDSHKVTQ